MAGPRSDRSAHDAGRATRAIPATRLPSGELVPVLGQGTWGFAENPARESQEIWSLRRGLELGMTLIDTAEMYAEGGAEELVGRAIAARRDEVFLVSKVLPQHATRRGMVAACQASLRRLETDVLDLYLLHWRGRIPLEETLDGFVTLQHAGLIRHWGVSNFALADMAELFTLPEGRACTTDQVLFNLAHRGIEWDLLDWCRERGLPVMAYSPIEQGRLLGHPVLRELAASHGATPAQIALAWVLDHEGVVAIPRAGSVEHVDENRAAVDVQLTAHDHRRLNDAFPAPLGPQPLELF